MSDEANRIEYSRGHADARKQMIALICKELRAQGERENTYEKQDCFERAANMVEEME